MKSTPPEGLGEKALAFWVEITETYDLRPDEMRVLVEVVREIDLIERMESAMRNAELVVKGSQGQPVAAPLVQELRQHRAVLTRLLTSLHLPDENNDAASRSAHGRALVAHRWAAS